MKFCWLVAMFGLLILSAGAEEILDANGTVTGNHKIIEVECGDYFEYPRLTAWDACDGELTNDIIQSGDEVHPELPGEYVLTYNVFDSAGNAAPEAIRTILVVDTEAPIITLYGENPVLVAMGEAYVDAGANAFDGCDGDLTARMIIGNGVDTGLVGQYTVTYDVEDAAGNTAQQALRVVNVVEGLPRTGSLSDLVLEEGMYYEWDGAVENEALVNGFQWYRHNGRFFEPLVDGAFGGGNFEGVATSTLQFAPFTARMAGLYMLEVTDDKTAVQLTANVSVEKEEGVPVAGMIGMATLAFLVSIAGTASMKRQK